MVNDKPEAKARLARSSAAPATPVLEGYTPLVRPDAAPGEDQETREWLAVPLTRSPARGEDAASETAPISTQPPRVASPQKVYETAPIPIQPPALPAAERGRETAPIAVPPPATFAGGRLGVPTLLRLAYGAGCVLVLVVAWAVSLGGPLESIFATPTPVSQQTPLPLPGVLLGLPPTPGAPTASAAPTTSVATPLPSPPPEPTPAPPAAESTPLVPESAPSGASVTAQSKTLTVQDVYFTGGEIPARGQYRGRSARLVPSASLDQPQRNELRVTFNLNIEAAGPVREATLTLVGTDSPDQTRTPILITLNGRKVYTGDSPLDDDSPTGGDDAANWSSYTWELDPATLRQGPNEIVLSNLAATGAENFIVIDYADINWTP